ncbi:MAG: hypothetical protein QM754_08890 [Tepidisphaeraceae bacterium]
MLGELRKSQPELTILLTTHLMDEADRCNRLAILDRGKLLANATPDELKDAIGGDVIRFGGHDLHALRQTIIAHLGLEPAVVENELHLERPNAHLFVPQLIEAAPGLIESITVGRPTLDDVFVKLTGRRLHREATN